jgi:DNA invertase Pin-like site-specific DNA recombinase
MNALFIKDLAEKVRRGQRGRVEAKRAAGGLSYGYDVVKTIGTDGEIVRSVRAINPAEAAVVLRVFVEYASGRSPRAIAADLNR